MSKRIQSSSLEIELIIQSARVSMDSATEERVQTILDNKLDWDLILRLSVLHCVQVLLHHNLMRSGINKVPARIQQALREEARSSVVNSLFLTGELLKILQLFREEGIDAIPFKGPVLALTAYGDVALRCFGDLDIVIRNTDFSRAKELLLSRGYRPWQDLTKSAEAAHLASEYAYTWANENHRTTIDLHWAFVQKRYAIKLEMEPLWTRLASVSIGGKAVPTFSVEDVLLYLCLHGTKHSWQRLVWICDVAELIRRNQKLDWDSILDCSRQLDIQRMVLLGLALARDLLEAPVPERVVSRIQKDRAIPALSGSIRSWLFAESVSPLAVIEQGALFLRLRERFRNKLPYLLYHFRKGVTPNQRDLDLLPFPRLLYFLYYALRLARLTKKYGRTAVAGLRLSREEPSIPVGDGGRKERPQS